MGMFDDLLQEVDKGNVIGLFLLDMSAAFDTVDHGKLKDVLERRFGVCGSALKWFSSYLQSRNFRVNVVSAIPNSAAARNSSQKLQPEIDLLDLWRVVFSNTVGKFSP
eukprot:sb/3477515/